MIVKKTNGKKCFISKNYNLDKIACDKEQLRTHCVSVRFNHEELQLLNSNRGEKSKGEWLRLASLNRLPVMVPQINIEAWKALADISQRLNKLLNHLESKSDGSNLTRTEIFAVKRQISELRSCLTAASRSVR